MMLVFQRHPEQRWREVADVLEELTTTWYFACSADCAVAVVPPYWKTTFCWQCSGLAIFAGPAVVSFVAKESGTITLRLNIAYAADPVVAVITSSGHKLFHTISRLASFK
ncbi:YbhQ family protein [Shigella sonnei]